MAYDSLYYFAKYVCKFSDIRLEPHWEVCKFIQDNLWSGDDLLLLLPRGTFKSSIVSVALPLWILVRNRDLRVVCSSAELSNSRNFLGLVRGHITSNELFRQLYGDWSDNDGGPFHSTAIAVGGRTKLRAEASITASSVDVTKVSQHYDLAIFDDLQTDKNVTSAEMIDKVQEYTELFVPILDPIETKQGMRRGPRLYVGTRWHFDDIYGRIISRALRARREGRPEGVRMMIAGAYRKDAYGRRAGLFFPSRLTQEYLDELSHSDTMSRYVFSCQYLNDPLPDEDVIFPISQANFWCPEDGKRLQGDSVLPIPAMLYRFTTLDPSLGEYSDSDWSAFVTVAVDAEWNLYVEEVCRLRCNTEELVQEMFRIHRQYAPMRFGVEEIAFQKAIIWGFEQACRRQGTWFHVQGLKTDTMISKEMRIRGFQPFWRAGKVYLRVRPKTSLTIPRAQLYHELVDGQLALADEAVRFPLGATKDCIDALAYMPQIVFPAGPPPAEPTNPNSFGALWNRLQKNKHGNSPRLRTN